MKLSAVLKSINLFFCHQINSKNVVFRIDDFGYTCNLISLKYYSSDDNVITNVVGIHEGNNTDSDVNAFFSDRSTFVYFPNNLNNFLINLSQVYCNNAEISVIERSDLESLGHALKVLSLQFNEIEVIAADLFESTPNLEEIYLDENYIKIVEYGAFQKLEKLITLQFMYNACYSGHATGQLGVVEMIEKIERKCKKSSTFIMFFLNFYK